MPKTLEEIVQELTTKPEDELMHYGRKGMKWYQHIFGKEQTRSSSGTKKSGDNGNTRQKPEKESLNSKNKKEQAKKAKKMSDRDLERIIRRLENENKYVKLTARDKDPWMERFLDKMKDVPINIVSGAATELGKNAAVNYFNKKYPSTKKGK